MMPHLQVLLTIHGLLWLLILLTISKIVSTATLVILGDYRAVHISSFRRLAGITGKVTPPLMAVATGLLEFSRGDARGGWLFMAASFLIACFAAYVVRLRGRGRFYGAADWMQRYLSPTQVKLILLAFLSVLFILALRIQ